MKICKIIVRQQIKKLLKEVYLLLTDRPYIYTNNSSNNRGKIFVSYLTMPLRKSHCVKYLNYHQNRRETLIICHVLKALNLSVVFKRFDVIGSIRNDYNIVFGLEPNFIKACKKNPKSIKVYYATGAYWRHQNAVIEKRTKDFNLIHQCDVGTSRMIEPHNAAEIADYIFQIGSKYTLETYPESIRSKIIFIRQSCHDFVFHDFINRKLKIFSTSEFIWMGSKGSILKGLDLLLDFFLNTPNKSIHIIGPIDKEVYLIYKNVVNHSPNIHIHGFLDLDSAELEEIALKSTFVIMPSGSEGGCPGAVINMMKLGCIPIVSRYAAFDGIEHMGFLIDGFSVNDIGTIVNRVSVIETSEIENLIRKNHEFATSNFNKNVFESDIREAFSKVMKLSHGK